MDSAKFLTLNCYWQSFLMQVTMLCCLYFLFLLSFCHGAGRSKPITTSLDAKWGTHSVALEIAEFLAEKNNDAFWSYIFTLRRLTDCKLYTYIIMRFI